MAIVNVVANWFMWTVIFFFFPFSLLGLKVPPIVLSLNFLSFNAISLDLPLILDGMGLVFICTVLFISTNIIQFSTSYMSEDPFLSRFILILMMFIGSMILLVLIPSAVFMLWGWDGLGLTSFILVTYYQNPKSLSAGLLTVYTNRLGDAFILCMLAMLLSEPSWDFIHQVQGGSSFVSVFMVLAGMTKSAQMPFSSWLPAAMAAPTPVSALVHSSTLVTAGVFILLRFSFNFCINSWMVTVLSGLALLTTLMASLSAVLEVDLKKIIALSTLSQLGLMMFTLSLDLVTLTFAHLIIHAMFKALMFLAAGVIIANSNHNQDLRSMNHSLLSMPISTSALIFSNLTLAAIPFSASYFSKDVILELALTSNIPWVLFPFLILVSMFTSSYAFRLSFHLVNPNSMATPVFSVNETSSNLLKPLLVMSIVMFISGVILNWILIQPIQEVPMTLSEKLVLVFLPMVGGVWMFSIIDYLFPCLYEDFCISMWFMGPIFSQAPLKLFYPSSVIFVQQVEMGVLEKILPGMINWVGHYFGGKVVKAQTTSANEYFFVLMFSIIVFLVVLS